MKRLLFTGVVHPERAWLTLPKIDFPAVARGGIDIGSVSVSIVNSQIVVLIDVDNDDLDLLTIKNGIAHLVERFVGVFDYLNGYCHSIDIAQCVLPSGEVVVFGVEHQVVSGRFAFSGDEYVGILNLTSGEEGLFIQQSISDLSKAIKYPVDTAFYCFRAIETLKQYFKKNCSEKEAWKMLSRYVGKDREYSSVIRRFADNGRHGVHEDISGAERDEIIQKAFEIVDTFINKMAEEKKVAWRLIRDPNHPLNS